MKPAHTPGPWTLETVPTSCGICHKIGPFPTQRTKLNGEQCESHACVYVDNGDGYTDEMMANARLIAAAPQLVAALEKCIDLLASIHQRDAIAGLPDVYRSARAALAAAHST